MNAIEIDQQLLQEYKQWVEETISTTKLLPGQEITPYLTHVHKHNAGWRLAYVVDTPRPGYGLNGQLISTKIPEIFYPLCEILYSGGTSKRSDLVP